MNQLSLPVAGITAYWGARCSYTFIKSLRVDVPLTSGVLQVLEVCPQYITNFKIQLRALESAREEEVRQMAKLAGIDEAGAIRRDEAGITYEASQESLRITYRGGIQLYRQNEKSGDVILAPLIEYAKGVGLFWPQTLAEEFVEIIP